MEFEWDPAKAARSLARHGVSVHESGTVLGDPPDITFSDPDHSAREDRYLTFGHASDGHLLAASLTDRGDPPAILSARRARGGKSMRINDLGPGDDDLRPEHDASVLKEGVRGKFLDPYRVGTNLALPAPEVRPALPSDESVNQALRSLMQGWTPDLP